MHIYSPGGYSHLQRYFSQVNESLPKESLAKSSLPKESLAKESLPKESLAKESLPRKSVPKEGSAGNFGEELRAAGFKTATFLDKNGWPRLNSDITEYLELLMNHRHNSGLKAPRVTQRPVPLENPPKCVTRYFNGPRAQPAHLVMILTLAFELDTLEAQLYELNDVVDEFVVFEGLYTQRGASKPQVFPRAVERFSTFKHKIKYYHQLPIEAEFHPKDQAVSSSGPTGQNWVNENIRQMAYNRYVKEEEIAGRSLNNTLFINADIDEIPPANGVQRFKYCRTEKLWASFCSVLYEPDFQHIREFPDFCGQLGNHYWPFPNILRQGEPLRNHGYHKNMYDEMPGVHVHARDPWSFLARKITTAEQGGFAGLGNDVVRLLSDPLALYTRYACAIREEAKKPTRGISSFTC